MPDDRYYHPLPPNLEPKVTPQKGLYTRHFYSRLSRDKNIDANIVFLGQDRSLGPRRRPTLYVGRLGETRSERERIK